MLTRHQYIRETGKRISHGAWERRQRAYEVHKALTFSGQTKMQHVDYVRNDDGTIKLGADGKGEPLVKLCTTLVLAEGTPKHNRKVRTRRDHWDEKNRRARYNERTFLQLAK
jgi:hypothetical protein